MKAHMFVLLTLAVLLASTLLCLHLVVQATVLAQQGLTFVIDAGHGGEDGGAVSEDGLSESSVNLAVARRTDALLGLCGLRSVMTRDSEEISYPPEADSIRKRKQADLEQRSTLVAAMPEAVLVSIHQNQYPSPGPRGVQVFYNDYDGSREFAVYAQELLLRGVGGSERAASRISDSIYLMRKAECPAILVECGFLSNPGELALLKSETYQTKLAVCIAAACMGHAEELERLYGKG